MTETQAWPTELRLHKGGKTLTVTFDGGDRFDLPAEAERHAYLCAWNDTVEPELQIAEPVIAAVVAATEGFSFAYLKELCLSSMMRWISNPEKAAMECVIVEQCEVLRQQMHAVQEAPAAETDPAAEEDDEE